MCRLFGMRGGAQEPPRPEVRGTAHPKNSHIASTRNGKRMITTNDHKTPAQESDLKAIYGLFAKGRSVTDHELIRRIRERSEAARQAVFARNGVLDIAVPYVRALRDGVVE